MTTCPTCGHDRVPEPSSVLNQESEVLLRVPERHYPLFRKLFQEMEMKLGMYGYGELANALKPYGTAFRQEFEIFRYFDDGALAMAMTGITQGYPAVLRTQPANGIWGQDRLDRPARHEVHVDFTFPDGSLRGLRISEGVPQEPLERFKDWFTDVAARLAPLGDGPENSPLHSGDAT